MADVQDAYAIVTTPFRGFRWLIDKASPTLEIVGLAPLLLGVSLLIVSRGIARYSRWARIAGAALLLLLVLFGALAIMGAIIEGDYDVAGGALPLVLVHFIRSGCLSGGGRTESRLDSPETCLHQASTDFGAINESTRPRRLSNRNGPPTITIVRSKRMSPIPAVQFS